jgi:hypothetical protein
MAQISRGPIDRAASYLSDGATVIFGTSSSLATVGGTLSSNTTSTCTIANTSETDLWTYSLPANALSVDGRGVRVTAYFTYAANADTKTVKIYFGSASATLDNSATSGNGVRGTMVVIRTGSNAQFLAADAVRGFAVSSSAVTTTTQTDTAAITIKVTGTNGTAAANDICFKGALVEAIGRP